MKNLPADFPQPPAENASLKAMFAWFFQVLTWLMARRAAGDKWWLGLGESQPKDATPPAALPDRTGAGERQGAGDAGAGAAAARTSGLRAEALDAPGPADQIEDKEAADQDAAPPPSPPERQRTAPRAPLRSGRSRRRPRRASAREPHTSASRPRLAGRHPQPTTGPPEISSDHAEAASHARLVTITKQN
jgi:hypothetical protein